MRLTLGRMIKRPVAALASSIEMLGQRIDRQQKIDAILSRIAHTLSRTSGRTSCIEPDGAGATRSPDREDRSPMSSDHRIEPPPTTDVAAVAERGSSTLDDLTPMNGARSRDTDLRDDMLKLVQYKILFVKRDYEAVFPEREEFISDNLSSADYISWKAAEFCQNLDKIERPREWSCKNYPPGAKGSRIHRLPEDDKKYLRVYYKVLARYTREKYRYEKKQIQVLEQIRNAIKRG